MIRYKGFAFFIKDGIIFIKDPRNNQVLMVRDAKNVDNQIELGRSMIEQHISDEENKMTEAEKELERQRDAYKEKLKTYLQGLWGCGWEEPFNKAVKEIEGDNKSE